MEPNVEVLHFSADHKVSGPCSTARLRVCACTTHQAETHEIRCVWSLRDVWNPKAPRVPQLETSSRSFCCLLLKTCSFFKSLMWTLCFYHWTDRIGASVTLMTRRGGGDGPWGGQVGDG